MRLVEISAKKPLIVSMYEKVSNSEDWGVYWVDENGIGHHILDFDWSPASNEDGVVTKEKIVVVLSSQNKPRPSILRFSGSAINRLRLRKMLVPRQFAVDLERWYLVKE